VNTFLSFAAHLNEKIELIVDETIELALDRLGVKDQFPEWRKETIARLYRKILHVFVEFMDSPKNTDAAMPTDFLFSWGKEVANQQLELGEKTSLILLRYPILKSSFYRVLTRISEEHELSAKETAFVLDQIGMMADSSMYAITYAYEQMIDQQHQEIQVELAQLSAPVVPVRQDAVVIPLVGKIDVYRAKYIMESALPKVTKMRITYIIVDFSGLLTKDIEILGLFQQMGYMLRLMGLKVVNTGMRPELVQAIGRSGIRLSDTTSFATVKQALEQLPYVKET
jgi:rsbT co-antagonist protein RsbR